MAEQRNNCVHKMKIITTHVFPPIPIRSCDWSAHIDGQEEDGPQGWGATEQEAREDLEDQIAEELEIEREGRDAPEL